MNQKRLEYLILLSSLILFSNCKQNETSPLENKRWLLGTWKFESPRGSIYEHRERENDSLLLGNTLILAGQDTIPVRFKLISSSTAEMIFQNKKHDFPQFISYRLVERDSLVAEISGSLNSNPVSEKFPMTRIKN